MHLSHSLASRVVSSSESFVAASAKITNRDLPSQVGSVGKLKRVRMFHQPNVYVCMYVCMFAKHVCMFAELVCMYAKHVCMFAKLVCMSGRKIVLWRRGQIPYENLSVFDV